MIKRTSEQTKEEQSTESQEFVLFFCECECVCVCVCLCMSIVTLFRDVCTYKITLTDGHIVVNTNEKEECNVKRDYCCCSLPRRLSTVRLTDRLVVGLVGYQKPLIVLQILVQRNNNNYNITNMHAFTKHKTSATRE